MWALATLAAGQSTQPPSSARPANQNERALRSEQNPTGTQPSTRDNLPAAGDKPQSVPVKAISHEEKQAAEQKRDRDGESDQSGKLSNILMLAFNAILAGTAIFGVVLLGKQIGLAKEQISQARDEFTFAKEQIESSAVDTMRMIATATKQAEAMTTLADANEVIANATKDAAAASEQQSRWAELSTTAMQQQVSALLSQAEAMLVQAKAAIVTAEAAEKAAGAATSSAETARATLHQTQRAYLTVEGFAFIEEIPIGAEFRIFNAGLTVARLTESVTCALIGDQLPDVVDYDYIGTIRSTTLRFIHPGKHVVMNLREIQPMSLDAFKRVKFSQGREQYLLYGRVTYDDIFGSRHVLGWSQSYGGVFWANQQTPGYDYAD